MEKIFKKSLALMVSAALCLTAFVGCLTVNAETAGSATVTVGEGKAKTTDAAVEVPVTIAVAEGATTGIAAAIFDITVDSTKFDFSKRNWDSCLTYDTKQNIHVSTITDGNHIQPVNGTTDTYRFLVEGLAEGSTDENTLGTFTSATFKLTFDVIDHTAGETAITFNKATMDPQACNAGTLDLQGKYTGDEKPFIVTTAAGKITVQAEQPACKHVWKFVSATPATGSDNSTNTEYTKGSITFKCADCDEEKTEVVNYSYYSRAQDSGLEYGSETLMRFGTRYENDHPRIATDANITDGYIVLTQKRLDTTVATKATQIKDCESTVNSNGQKIYQTRIGIPALAMSDDVTSVFYAYDSTSDAWYSGYQVTYSVKTAAEGILSTSTKDLQKTALVNLLNYGAAAQDYFATKDGYTELNDVVRSNAGIDSYQSYAIEADPFDTSSMNLVYQDDGSFVFCFNKANLIVDSKTTNRIFFRIPSSYSGASTAVDMTGYTVEVTYTDFLGEQQTEIYTADQFMPEGRVNRFYIEAPFATPDLRQVATFVVKNPDGEVAGPASTVSIANIAASIISTSTDSNQTSMINNLMAFSDAAYDYLTTKN